MICTLITYERQLRRQKNVGDEVGVGDGRESIGEFYDIFDVRGVGKVLESKGGNCDNFELYARVGDRVDRGNGGVEVAQNLAKSLSNKLSQNREAFNTNGSNTRISIRFEQHEGVPGTVLCLRRWYNTKMCREQFSAIGVPSAQSIGLHYMPSAQSIGKCGPRVTLP